MPSDATEKKSCTHRTSDDFPAQPFGELLDDLGPLVKNMMQAGKDEGVGFAMLTRNTLLQQKSLDLLAVPLLNAVRLCRIKNGRNTRSEAFFTFGSLD